MPKYKETYDRNSNVGPQQKAAKRGKLGTLTFQYNPQKIPWIINNKLTDLTGPNISYPDIVFGGRDAQLFKFELFLNEWGDSPGQVSVEKQITLLNAMVGSQSRITESNFGNRVTVGYNSPQIVRLNMGAISVRVMVQSLDVQPIKYDHDLKIIRAKVNITLKRVGL